MSDNVWLWEVYMGADVFKIDIPGDSAFVSNLHVGEKVYPKSDESASYLNLGGSQIYLSEIGSTSRTTINSTSSTMSDNVWLWEVYMGADVFKIDIPNNAVNLPYSAPSSYSRGNIWLLNADNTDADTIAVRNGSATKYFVSL
jgi:hypothetical protein